MELKLLCTYEEWKRKSFEKTDFEYVSEKAARALELATKLMSKNLTDEERKELDSYYVDIEEESNNKKFTELTHQITDLCFNPKKHYVDIKKVGKLQYELERLKYPMVLPVSEENTTNKEE